MEVLSNIFFEEPDGEIYYDILNSQGKEWLIGSKDIRTAFEIYQPTAIKGKILKSFFPCICRFPFVYSRLHIKKKKLKLQPEIEHILQRTFGNDVSISCFGGTPCVHQKAVIQIYRNLKILGYCKVARSQDVGYLFDKECENLNYLREKSVDSIPEVLFRCDLDDLKLFCQSSVKDKSGQTIDRMTEKHWLFLANLYNKTRTVIKFEETDYYALLKRVKKNAVVLKETDLEIVQRACELISKKYNNSTVEFGFYHGDFTPWNTVIENGKIKVFDFEYASFAIQGIDGYPVDIEVKMLEGQPVISIIGLGDQAVKEAAERIQAAIDESGYVFPKKRVIISLAPSDKKKSGSHFDLAMAVGVLCQNGDIGVKNLKEWDQNKLDAEFDYIINRDKATAPEEKVRVFELLSLDEKDIEEGYPGFLEKAYNGEIKLEDYENLLYNRCWARKYRITLPDIEWEKIHEGVNKQIKKMVEMGENQPYSRRTIFEEDKEYFLPEEWKVHETIKNFLDENILMFEKNKTLYINLMRKEPLRGLTEMQNKRFNKFDIDMAEATSEGFEKIPNEDKEDFVVYFKKMWQFNISVSDYKAELSKDGFPHLRESLIQFQNKCKEGKKYISEIHVKSLIEVVNNLIDQQKQKSEEESRCLEENS